MLRVLCIGDLHINKDNLLETVILRDRLLELTAQANPELIVVMGDTLHNFNNFTSHPHRDAEMLINDLSKFAPVILLIGNHDIPGKRLFMSDLHPFTGLSYHPNVTVVDTMCHIGNINGVQYAAVPYSPDGRFMEALQTNSQFDIESTHVIFAHQSFAGCSNPAYTSKGDPWDETYPLVISGHIHQYERIRNNIIYVGTPRQTDFGDTDPEKTISLFEIRVGHLQFVEHRIPTRMPPKVTIEVCCSRVNRWKLPKDLAIIKGNVKIKLIGTRTEINTVKSHPKVAEWNELGILISYHTIVDEEPSHTHFSESLGNRHKLSFQEEMAKALASNPRHMKIYEQLF